MFSYLSFPSFLVFSKMRELTEIEMIRFSKRIGRRSAVTLGSKHLFVGTRGQVHCGKRKVSIPILLSKVPFPCPAGGSPL